MMTRVVQIVQSCSDALIACCVRILDDQTTMNCSLTANLSIEDQSRVEELSENVLQLSKIMFYMAIPLSLIALIINTCFIVASFAGLRSNRLSFRLYVFLLSRSGSDFLVSLIFSLFSVLYVTSAVDLKVTLLAISLATTFYWASAESYAALAIIKLIAVSKPLFYRNKITNRTCIKILIGAWGLATLYVIVQAIIAKAVFTNTTLKPFCWDKDSCIQLAQWYFVAVVGFTYFSIVALLFTIIYFAVHQNRNRVRTRSDLKSSNNTQLWKLIVHMAFYWLCTSFELPAGVFIVSETTKYITAADYLCMYGSVAEATKANVISVVTIVWHASLQMRIIVDPLLNFAMDRRLRLVLLSLFNIYRGDLQTPPTSTTVYRQTRIPVETSGHLTEEK